MQDQQYFIKADPDIILDKTLSDRSWLAYCRLEQIAKSSRLVLGYHNRLDMPEPVAIAALADLSHAHPKCFKLDGHRLTLADSPAKFVRVPFPLIDADLPTWQKRLITAVLDQVYESTRHRGVGRININQLNDTCRVPARSRKDRWALIRGTIDLMVQQGVIEILSQRPGACTTCRLTWGATCGATCGANTAIGTARTTGSDAAAPQVEDEPHHRFAGAAPQPRGQKPEEETKERNQKTRNRGEAGTAPAGENPLMSRGGDPTMSDTPPLGTADPDDTPRTPTTWERIESASPCKSGDSPAELAELWRDRRAAIASLYRRVGLPWDAETVTADFLAVQKHCFDTRLPLGALLGPRWDRLHQAWGRWLAGAEGRAWQHLPYLVGALGGPPLDLADVSDETIRRTWEEVTGYSVPCPPVALVRRLLA